MLKPLLFEVWHRRIALSDRKRMTWKRGPSADTPAGSTSSTRRRRLGIAGQRIVGVAMAAMQRATNRPQFDRRKFSPILRFSLPAALLGISGENKRLHLVAAEFCFRGRLNPP